MEQLNLKSNGSTLSHYLQAKIICNFGNWAIRGWEVTRVPTNVVNCKYTGMFQTKRYKVYRVPHLLLSTLTINHPPKVFYIIQPNMTYIFLLPTFLYCVHCPAPLISLLIIKPGMLSVTAHKDHHVFFNSSSCILLCGDTIIYSPSTKVI